MKAAYITGHGGNEVVVVGDRSTPCRRGGNAIVQMKAATLNRVDLYMRDSGAGITHELPQIMGVDGAGVIAELGPDEHHLTVGQSVAIHPAIGCGKCEFCVRGESILCTRVQFLGEHRDGTWAEYVSVPSKNLFAAPAGFEFFEAAALGVSHLTAWRMLFTKAQLKPWETVLIFGIGGGVSLAALQLANAIGARTIVTSRSEHKLQRALTLGAGAVINGHCTDVANQVHELTGGRGVDVVIENVGEAVWSSALKSLVKGGRLVTCGATSGDRPSADIRRLFVRQLSILGSTLGTLSEFADLLGFCGRNRLRPVIDSRFLLEETHDALNRLASGEQFGKIVLEL